MIDTELAKYGPAGVAIALIISLAYVIPKIVVYMKNKDDKFLDYLCKSEERHTKAYDKLDTTLNGLAVTVSENTVFMKSLNGKLEKAIREKAKGQ